MPNKKNKKIYKKLPLKGYNPPKLEKEEDFKPALEMKHPGPMEMNHPMQMSPYKMKPAVLRHMSHNK
jgi:hypothetical protein